MKGVNFMKTLGVIDSTADFEVIENEDVGKQNGLAQVAYRDDCSDAQYCRGA